MSSQRRDNYSNCRMSLFINSMVSLCAILLIRRAALRSFQLLVRVNFLKETFPTVMFRLAVKAKRESISSSALRQRYKNILVLPSCMHQNFAFGQSKNHFLPVIFAQFALVCASIIPLCVILRPLLFLEMKY